MDKAAGFYPADRGSIPLGCSILFNEINMTQRHKHYDMIVAWAEGQQIQSKKESHSSRTEKQGKVNTIVIPNDFKGIVNVK